MKVKLDFDKMVCTVTREAGDPHFHTTERAEAESTFLYLVRMAEEGEQQ